MSDQFSTREYSILESTKYGWPIVPKSIRHVIMTVEQSGGQLIFQAVDVEPDDAQNPPMAAGIGSMTDYAISKLRSPVPQRFAPSPLDVKVRQCWLLIQLDPDINWQFTRGKVPCTLKAQDLAGDNIYLRHVFDDQTNGLGPVAKDDCKTIFFGVVHREKPSGVADPNPGSCFINLHVEFLQKVGGQETRLQIIIDPDVPNEGPDAFP